MRAQHVLARLAERRSWLSPRTRCKTRRCAWSGNEGCDSGPRSRLCRPWDRSGFRRSRRKGKGCVHLRRGTAGRLEDQRNQLRGWRTPAGDLSSSPLSPEIGTCSVFRAIWKLHPAEAAISARSITWRHPSISSRQPRSIIPTTTRQTRFRSGALRTSPVRMRKLLTIYARCRLACGAARVSACTPGRKYGGTIVLETSQ